MDRNSDRYVVTYKLYAVRCMYLLTNRQSNGTWSNFHRAPRLTIPTVTQDSNSSNQSPPMVTYSRTVEGHVSQDVEVQVLSSALTHGKQMAVSPNHVPEGNSFRHMVSTMYF
jgi:hypothetical protein